MPDLTAELRVLLGTVDWERPDWLQSYYPDDLPPEWRLAYYANDCGCVLVPHRRWVDADPEQWTSLLAETPSGLVLFLECASAAVDLRRPVLDAFAGHAVILLVDAVDPTYSRFPQWAAQGGDAWADSGQGRLVRWSIGAFDLRALRAQAERLGGFPGNTAVVLDGPGADPGRLAELRILFELLGRA